MRVLTLGGSGRGNRGVTGRLLAALAEGLAAGEAEVTGFETAALRVAPCRACLACLHQHPGECAQRDDMDRLYPHLRGADLLVVATPVYLDGLPAPLKAVFDRCLCSLSPFLARDPSGRVRHPAVWSLPPAWLLLASCGFPEPTTFEPLVAHFRAMARNAGARPLAEFLVPGSLAIQMEPAALAPRLDQLRRAGRRLATGETPPPALRAAINRPLFGRDRYLALAARYEAWCRRSQARHRQQSG